MKRLVIIQQDDVLLLTLRAFPERAPNLDPRAIKGAGENGLENSFIGNRAGHSELAQGLGLPASVGMRMAKYERQAGGGSPWVGSRAHRQRTTSGRGTGSPPFPHGQHEALLCAGQGRTASAGRLSHQRRIATMTAAGPASQGSQTSRSGPGPAT